MSTFIKHSVCNMSITSVSIYIHICKPLPNCTRSTIKITCCWRRHFVSHISVRKKTTDFPWQMNKYLLTFELSRSFTSSKRLQVPFDQHDLWHRVFTSYHQMITWWIYANVLKVCEKKNQTWLFSVDGNLNPLRGKHLVVQNSLGEASFWTAKLFTVKLSLSTEYASVDVKSGPKAKCPLFFAHTTCIPIRYLCSMRILSIPIKIRNKIFQNYLRMLCFISWYFN